MPVLCVDLSKWDGDVSIPKLKEAGVDAVIAKCGGGDQGLYEDSKWEANYANCKAAGMPVGAYFYSAATTVNQAIREAEYVLKLIKGKQLEYPVYIDVEEKTQQALSESTLRAVIQAWLDTVGDGWMRGVYTWKWLMPSGLDCETWFCAWTKTKPGECGMWQFGGEVNLLRPTTVAGYRDMDQSYAYRDYPSIIKAAGLNGFKRKEAKVALSVSEKIAQVSEHHAKHDSHGYSQYNRDGDGTIETIALSDGTKVTVHGGDVDCSELVRECVNCALSGRFSGPIAYMWTGNQYAQLTAHGFERLPFSKGAVRRGDILWRAGHTGVALGGGRQAEAVSDENHGLGGRKGDQTGAEVAVNPLSSSWTYIYRYGSSDDEGEWFDVSQTIKFKAKSRVHVAPKVSSKYTYTYQPGESVTIDGLLIAEGYTWGTYIGSKGARRYVILGSAERVAK